MKNSEINAGFDAIEILTRGRRSKAKRIKAVAKRQKEKLSGIASKNPEVMVKISGGGQSVAQVFNHMTYITRNGKLEGITEDNEKISSPFEVKELLREWQVDTTRGYGKVRLAFNIVLSMPAGTPADGVQSAAAEFAKDNFWNNHRYMMVLHTDTPHPHVHVVVKAESEDRHHRINVTKAVLDEWRDKFAEKLREQGISANATPREVRGQTLKAKSQAIYHLEKRGASKVLEAKVAQVAQQLLVSQEEKRVEPWTAAIQARREKIVQLFSDAAKALRESNEEVLASNLEKFSRELPKVVTQNELISKRLMQLIAESRKSKELSPADLALQYQVVSHAKQNDTSNDRENSRVRNQEKDLER